MLSSPRKPVSTMRIFSSAENCRRVARRIPFTTCSAGSFTGPDFCPICAPLMATMGQKSSLPQLTRSVSVVLMPDTDSGSAVQAKWVGENIMQIESCCHSLMSSRRGMLGLIGGGALLGAGLRPSLALGAGGTDALLLNCIDYR